MAEEQTEEEAQPSKGIPLIPLIIIVVVAIGASVGATLFFLGGGDETAATTEEEEAKGADKGKALYHNMRPPFIVNYLDGNKPRYLQADVTVMARNPLVVESVINHTPLIRAEILNLFADQDFEDLQSDGGKVALRESLLDTINTTLDENGADGNVKKVLLTNFVMQ